MFLTKRFFLTFKKTLRSSKAEQDIIQYKFYLHKKNIAHWPQISINWRSETPDKTKKARRKHSPPYDDNTHSLLSCKRRINTLINQFKNNSAFTMYTKYTKDKYRQQAKFFPLKKYEGYGL